MTVEEALARPLSAMPGWWVHIRCGGCPTSTTYPFLLLGERHGPGRLLGDIVPRLRCRRCHAAPASVELVDNPMAGSIGALPARWRVQLLAGR